MLCRAVVPSETYAYKAQRILAANGYYCEIIRSTSRHEGCGHSLRIAGERDAVQELLRREGIPVQDIRIERGGV